MLKAQAFLSGSVVSSPSTVMMLDEHLDLDLSLSRVQNRLGFFPMLLVMFFMYSLYLNVTRFFS